MYIPFHHSGLIFSAPLKDKLRGKALWLFGLPYFWVVHVKLCFGICLVATFRRTASHFVGCSPFEIASPKPAIFFRSTAAAIPWALRRDIDGCYSFRGHSSVRVDNLAFPLYSACPGQLVRSGARVLISALRFHELQHAAILVKLARRFRPLISAVLAFRSPSSYLLNFRPSPIIPFAISISPLFRAFFGSRGPRSRRLRSRFAN